MFIEINGAMINTYSISSFKAVDEKLEQSDGTYIDNYAVVYTIQSGTILKENFQDKSDRDDRIDALKEKLLMK